MAAMRSSMAAVSSIVEPFGMETVTLTSPSSISGMSSMPAWLTLSTLTIQMTTVSATPAQRWVIRKFSELRYARNSGFSVIGVAPEPCGLMLCCLVPPSRK